MAHFLFAWELGANLGHATRMRSVALALKARGHELTFVLRDVVGARALLGPWLGRSLQAPLSLNSTLRPAWSMADVLLSCGYDSARTLGSLADAWRAVFELSGCDAVLADHAPTALLAARLAGLPALHVGHGFSLPPRHSPLPVFRDWADVPAAHAAEADALALGHVNAVLSAHGVAELPQLCDLFYPEQTLLCTWPELDHYAGLGRSHGDFWGPDCEFQPGAPARWPAAPGPRVFAYLRAAHPEHAQVLHALDALGCATLCFMPDRAESTEALPNSAHIHYSTEPIDLAQALPECALVVCHAGQATVAQAARLGIPCLMLPTQSEQFLLARQAERFGLGCNAASLARPVDYAALVTALTDPQSGAARAARALAEKHRFFDPSALTAAIAFAAETLLPTSG